MRLRTNHVNVHTDPVGFVISIAAAVTLAMLLAAAAWTRDGLSYRRSLPVLQAEIQRLPRAETEATASATEKIDRDALRKTLMRARALNALPGAGGGEILTRLMQFERALPAKARVSRLQYQANTRRWSLLVESEDAADLTAFIRKLEAGAGFAGVLVQSQTRDDRKQGSSTRTELWLNE